MTPREPKNQAYKPRAINTGVSPNWSNLPRRKCDNCGTSYRPKRPMRPGFDKYGFCRDECKKQFHKYGSAYIQIRPLVERHVKALAAELRTELQAIAAEAAKEILARLADADRIVQDLRAHRRRMIAHRK
ncbi:MAG TPA: hypothetical protein VF760_15160 [Xanthobacteraceae bacterium]